MSVVSGGELSAMQLYSTHITAVLPNASLEHVYSKLFIKNFNNEAIKTTFICLCSSETT